MKRIPTINLAQLNKRRNPGKIQTQVRTYDPADTPVAYNAAKQVVSYYGDDSWDLSSMSTDGTSAITLHAFTSPGTAAFSPLSLRIREQHKALMWRHMDKGKIRAPKTLRTANLALTAWCRKAENHEVDLFTFLTNPQWLTTESKDINPTYLYLTNPLLLTLWRHREELGVQTKIQLQMLKDVLSNETQSRPEYKQTPLIPSRVYCEILAGLTDRMQVIEDELDLLLGAYTLSKQTSRSISKIASGFHSRTQKKSLKLSITNDLKSIGYDPNGKEKIHQFINSRISLHQVSLMLVVAAFSGMRNGEVSILPLKNVLTEFEQYGSVHYEIQGYTHKLHNGVKRPASWITSHQGVRAIQLAQRIARTIEQEHDKPLKAGQQALLFPTTGNPSARRNGYSLDTYRDKIREIVCPLVVQTDIDELECLELSNSWESDDIIVGQRWPLTFHQLRRSLAVYAHRSGMVSLPVLKSQLQHITDEMALYYSDGFSRAVNLVFDEQHFSHEWNAAKSESSYYAYTLSVLFNDDDLLGRGSQHMANVIESRSLEDTLRLFQENKIAYRETPLGGCASTEPCKIEPMEPIPYQCLEKNCINQIVSSKRLDHIIRFQKGAVASLERNEHGSVEHRLEARHLEILLAARERLTKGVE
ncbi:hypothetical protein [Comamonas thiooxydans]|uniref:hypothetical protein n=1 Tax=Comamonas thiooxydans TaxID=363952 RepID=UPI000A8DF79A|nr:hypothetical protein [Comamonas thiooxydans]